MSDNCTRADLLDKIRDSFEKYVGKLDYVNKYVKNESDIQASLYRIIRNFLDEKDKENRWRLFLDWGIDIDKSEPKRKPDFVFTTCRGDCKSASADINLEILVEVKMHPTIESIIGDPKKDIEGDCPKMIKIANNYPDDDPNLMVLAILEPGADVDEWESKVMDAVKNTDNLEVKFLGHDDLFQGDWPDAWEKKFRHS